MSAEKDDFLRALRDDWNNDALRKVYADWLEEHGEPEEAARQRRWPQVRAESQRWLEEFAAGHEYTDYYSDDEPRTKKLTVSELFEIIQAQHVGDRMELCDILADDATRKRFWECYEVVTGREPTEGEKVESSYFPCAC